MSGRGALNLLSVYGEDSSSDDEVPIGRVSTKRCHKSDSEEDEKRSPKIFQSSVKFSSPDIKLEKEEYLDDPLLHEGRRRSFPHERGNWATFIYIPYESNDDIQSAVRIICNKLYQYNFKCISNFHISLTKVVILRHHWIESFIASIKENIININRFIVMFDCLNVYCNEERSRTFIGLEIKTGYNTLLNLATIFNRSLKEFNLPEFYKNPSFHMSLAWCVGDCEEAVKNLLPELNKEITEMESKFDDISWYIVVNQVQCKVGNKLFTFDIP